MKAIISILLILTILVAGCTTVQEDENTKVFTLDKKYKECRSARMYGDKIVFHLTDSNYYQYLFYDGYISQRRDIRVDFTTLRVFADGTVIWVAEKEGGELVLVSNNNDVSKPYEQDFKEVVEDYSKKSDLVPQDKTKQLSCGIKGNKAVIKLS